MALKRDSDVKKMHAKKIYVKKIYVKMQFK